MNWSTDLTEPNDEQEVFLLCMAHGEQTIIMARRHVWPKNTSGPPEDSGVRIVAWQSTWDGRRILHPYRPYAWSPVPDEKTLPVEPAEFSEDPPVKRGSRAHIN